MKTIHLKLLAGVGKAATVAAVVLSLTSAVTEESALWGAVTDTEGLIVAVIATVTVLLDQWVKAHEPTGGDNA